MITPLGCPMRVWRAVAVIGVGMASVVSGAETGKESTPLVLTRDGQPTAALVLTESPTKAAQFAAFELQWHVRAISGAVLPIQREDIALPDGHVKLCVGDGAAARALGLRQDAFELQEYAVRTGRNQVVLVGKDADDRAEVKYDLDALGDAGSNADWPGFWEEQGTLHAAYDFLRDACGVRWFNPTDTGALLPRQPTLTVKAMDLRRSPTFRYRDAGIHNAEAYDARVSMWGKRKQGFEAWESLAYADSRARMGDSWRVKRLQATLFLLRMRNGGELCRANHSLYHYYELFWEPSKNEANAEYFVKTRPELFAQGYEGDRPPQMCYTSRALIEQVAQEAGEYFDKGGYPYKTVLSNAPLGFKWGENYFCVEPMDNALFCRCAACQKWLEQGKDYGAVEHFSRGTHSDYFFQFVNAVQQQFAKTHANTGKSLVTLAYMTHAWPPRALKLDPAVAVQFCFASNSAPWSRKEYDHELGLVRTWGEEAASSGRAVYVWCYYGHLYRCFADSGNFHCFPGFFAHAIDEQMKLFKQLGYRGMFHCGLPPEVGTYVMFRLMDNADLDVDAVLGEYFTGLYGTAAGPLKKLYLAIEAVYCDPALRPQTPDVPGTSVQAAWEYLGTAERMAEYAMLMEEARAQAETEREKRNVALFDLGTWQYMAQGRAQYAERMAAPIPAVRAPAVPGAGGDPAKAAWDQAKKLSGGWFVRGSATTAPRKLAGRVAHDDRYLYVELVDPCDTSKLTVSPSVACYDDWELFLSTHRGRPYRQFLIGPTGMVKVLLNGEVNWRMHVPLEEHGVRAAADTTAPDRWTTRIAIPLKEVVPGGAKPGATIYMNVIRVTGPAITGTGLGIDTWVPHTTVHELDRAAAVTLAK